VAVKHTRSEGGGIFCFFEHLKPQAGMELVYQLTPPIRIVWEGLDLAVRLKERKRRGSMTALIDDASSNSHGLT
jgi:hypothetical protein